MGNNDGTLGVQEAWAKGPTVPFLSLHAVKGLKLLGEEDILLDGDGGP